MGKKGFRFAMKKKNRGLSISFTLSERKIGELEMIAEAHNFTRSFLINRIVTRALDDLDNGEGILAEIFDGRCNNDI